MLDERWIRSLHVESMRRSDLHAEHDPHVLFQASTIGALLDGAYDARGTGISVLSESLARIAMPGLTFRKLVGVTRTADHAVVYRKNESAPVVTAFIRSLRTQAKRR